jgi:hypothetical protein
LTYTVPEKGVAAFEDALQTEQLAIDQQLRNISCDTETPDVPVVTSHPDLEMNNHEKTTNSSHEPEHYVPSPTSVEAAHEPLLEGNANLDISLSGDNFLYGLDFTPLDTFLLQQPAWASTGCQCAKTFRFSNQILGQCSRLKLQTSPTHQVRDADIAIRAVLNGWNAVTKKYALDPLWAILRHADEAIFGRCDAIERLAVLRVMILMIRVSALHDHRIILDQIVVSSQSYRTESCINSFLLEGETISTLHTTSTAN